MADSYPGLVKGVTVTSGTGTYVITTATTVPYRSLAQAVADGSLTSGDKVQYTCRDITVLGDASFEAGEGTFTVAAGPTYQITRDTIFDGSNGPGVPVSWGLSGQRDFYLTSAPSSVTARTDRANTFTLNQTISHASNPTLSIAEVASSPLSLIDIDSSFARISKTSAVGAALLDIEAQPSGANNSFIRFFRNTTTVGSRTIQVFKGDGTATSTASINAASGEPTFGDSSAVINARINGSAGAGLLLSDAAASANNKLLQILTASGVSSIRALNDALTVKYTFLTLDHVNSRIGVNSTTPSAAVDIRANVVINDAGASTIGLRVEGDTDANLFVTDPANDRVYIGGASGTSKLNVNGTSYFSGGVALDVGLVINETGSSSGNLRVETQGNANAFVVDTASDQITCGVHLRASAEFSLIDGVTAPTAALGRAFLYVDTADGDLKVRFSDGVTKTIATDT